jgi:hypothetical protein
MAHTDGPDDGNSLAHGKARSGGRRGGRHRGGGGGGGGRKKGGSGGGRGKGAHHPRRPAEHRAGVGEGSARGGVPRSAPHARSGEALRDLTPGNHAHANGGYVAAGLGGVLLELVGEAGLRAGQVLEAWQREQDRLTNRAWRRPGGLARMGGL